MKKLFVIKAGATFPETTEKQGDFEEMILQGLALDKEKTQVVNAPLGDDLPDVNLCLGVVITGAHCMVTDNLSWSLAIEAWLPALIAAEVPLLGICYGHQLLGRAMGGEVKDHPGGKEVGSFNINLGPQAADDLLFNGLPERFPVHATHTQSVIKLPPNAVLLAGNDFEPHHAFRIGRCAWGVQFHPEYNVSVMKDYIRAQADKLSQAGQNVCKLLEKVTETPTASSILQRFAKIALQYSTP